MRRDVGAADTGVCHARPIFMRYQQGARKIVQLGKFFIQNYPHPFGAPARLLASAKRVFFAEDVDGKIERTYPPHKKAIIFVLKRLKVPVFMGRAIISKIKINRISGLAVVKAILWFVLGLVLALAAGFCAWCNFSLAAKRCDKWARPSSRRFGMADRTGLLLRH